MDDDSRQGQIDAARLAAATGEAIHNLRIELGISQATLSERAGLDRSYLGLLERGKRGASIESLWRISISLGIRPTELVSRIESLTGEIHAVGKDTGYRTDL